MRRKIQFQNRLTDLSLEINHIDSQSLLTNTDFHPSNRRSLVSEFELWKQNLLTLCGEEIENTGRNLIASLQAQIAAQPVTWNH
jgi:hypothetical protein